MKIIEKSYFSEIKRRAKKKNKKFELDIEFLNILWKKQDYKCSLSKLPIKKAGRYQINKQIIYGDASLDRIDSNKGYCKNNVQWVHKKINFMKHVLTNKEFIELCTLVSKNK